MDTAEKKRFFLMISAVEFFSAPVRLLVRGCRDELTKVVATDEDFHCVGAEA